jgi:hypothetical protein
MFYDFYSNKFFSDQKIQEKKEIIFEQSKRYKELLGHSYLKRLSFVDTCFLGGDLIGDILSNHREVPKEIIAAYEHAYPDLAAETPLQDTFMSMNNNEKLQGLMSGIKGKLFELKYCDYLNDGELPDGYIAKIAESATQPGWDLQINGPNGEIVQLLQAKATDSVNYVHEALERYPDIDIVTTDEVYSHLVLNDAAENIIGSGINNAELQEYIEQTLSGSGIEMNWSPPILSLAMIAFSTYNREGMDLYGKAKEFGERFGASYICLLLGRGVASLTGLWPLGIITSLSSRYWAGKGRAKRDVFFQLIRTIDNNEKIIKRIEAVVR